MLSTLTRRTALVALALVTSCGNGSDPGTPAELRVLFVGNSHTAVNSLPALVNQMASASGRTLTFRVEARPNFSLEDHWTIGNAPALIREGGWDVVVMQQGSSALPESQRNLLEWGGRLSDLIKANGGRPMFYMVWPTTDRTGDRDAVRQSYTNVAVANDAMLAPAGEVWREAWRTDGSLALYDPDGLHGSLMGTYAAALSVYGILFGVSPVGAAAPAGILPGVATLLQESARVANERYGRR